MSQWCNLTANEQIAECQPSEECTTSIGSDGDPDLVCSQDAAPQLTLHNPWPHLNQFFQLCSASDNGNLSFQCMLCGPTNKRLKCHKSSLHNLKSHIARKHIAAQKEFLDLLSKHSHRGRRSTTDSLDWAASTSVTSQVDAVSTIEPLLGKKRKIESSNLMQESFGVHDVCQSFGPLKIPIEASQEHADKALIDCFIFNMWPLEVVDSDSFIKLCATLNSKITIMSKQKLYQKITDIYQQFEMELISTLRQVPYVATTVDCWMKQRRAYLAMTAHWIDPTTRQRHFALLTLERIGGDCFTSELLSQAIVAVHERFSITDKVLRIVTDSGCNFRKAFALDLGSLLSVDGSGSDCDEHDSDNDDDDRDNTDDDAEEAKEASKYANDTELETIVPALAITDLLTKDTDVDCLPPIMRCVSHTINLVARENLQLLLTGALGDSAIAADRFRVGYVSIVEKLRSLCILQRRCTSTAGVIKSELGRKLAWPHPTRWESIHNCVRQLRQLLLSHQPEIRALCAQFQPDDLEFIEEYELVTAPLVLMLDILRDDRDAYLGILLPTISAAIDALKSARESGLRYCLDLAVRLESAFAKQFQLVFEDTDCLLSSAFHPKFRLAWLQKFSDRSSRADELRQSMTHSLAALIVEDSRIAEETLNPDVSTKYDEETSKKHAFLRHLMHQPSKCDSVKQLERTSTDKAVKLVSEWTGSPYVPRAGLTDSAFIYERHLCCAFVRYNTPVASCSNELQRLLAVCRQGLRAGSLPYSILKLVAFIRCNRKLFDASVK